MGHLYDPAKTNAWIPARCNTVYIITENLEPRLFRYKELPSGIKIIFKTTHDEFPTMCHPSNCIRLRFSDENEFEFREGTLIPIDQETTGFL
jgi:hypothetical protein